MKIGADPSTDHNLVASLWDAAQAVDEAKTWVWEEFGDFEDIVRWWKEYFEDLLKPTHVFHRGSTVWG